MINLMLSPDMIPPIDPFLNDANVVADMIFHYFLAGLFIPFF